MTVNEAIAMLRERRALETVEASIRHQSTIGPEWAYILYAITDRLKLSTYAIAMADPQILAHAEAVLNAEPDPRSAFSENDWATAWAVD
jgi:hypothetical protein